MSRTPRHVRAAALVALIAFAVYVGSFRTITTVDVTTNVLLAYSLVREGDPFLERYRPDQRTLTYLSYAEGGHEVSPYQPGASMFAVPFVMFGDAVGLRPPEPASVTVIGKLAGAAATALSVFFVHLAAARIAGPRAAIPIASLYAFATIAWPISGGGLWQHGPAQLFLSIGLFQLLSQQGLWRARSGLAFGLAAICRHTAGLFAVAAGASLLVRDRGAFPRFVLWTLPAAALLLAYDLVTFGRIVTRFTTASDSPAVVAGTVDGLFAHDVANAILGILGTLVSPSRGIFVYSPFLLLAAYALVRMPRARHSSWALRPQLAAFAITVLVYGTAQEWWAGPSYGERYLAEGLPLLAIGLAVWYRAYHTRAYAAPILVATGALGIAIAAIGATVYDWTRWPWDKAFSSTAGMWRPDVAQPLYTLLHAPDNWDASTPLTGLICVAAVVLLYRLWRRYRVPLASPERLSTPSLVRPVP